MCVRLTAGALSLVEWDEHSPFSVPGIPRQTWADTSLTLGSAGCGSWWWHLKPWGCRCPSWRGNPGRQGWCCTGSSGWPGRGKHHWARSDHFLKQGKKKKCLDWLQIIHRRACLLTHVPSCEAGSRARSSAKCKHSSPCSSWPDDSCSTLGLPFFPSRSFKMICKNTEERRQFSKTSFLGSQLERLELPPSWGQSVVWLWESPSPFPAWPAVRWSPGGCEAPQSRVAGTWTQVPRCSSPNCGTETSSQLGRRKQFN